MYEILWSFLHVRNVSVENFLKVAEFFMTATWVTGKCSGH